MKRIGLILIIVCVASSLFCSLLVQANPPTNVTLKYDIATHQLSVTITHPVIDQTTHYIITVEIKKNNETIHTETYTEQPVADTFTYTYIVNATTNDSLEVTATCNRGGLRSAQLIVGDSNTTNKSTPGFEVAVLLCLALPIALFKRRKET